MVHNGPHSQGRGDSDRDQGNAANAGFQESFLKVSRRIISYTL